ncbi:MAG: serine acetyltransferase [Planctomycetaceae bacterium]|jgi:serine O-acetyltransferase|nr:serine acetyltransferase [Planctomycetaceae bacterium]
MQISDIIGDIVSSYNETGTTRYFDNSPLPQLSAVTEMIDELKGIIYPGYRNLEALHSANIEVYVGAAVEHLAEKLTDIIERAFTHSEFFNDLPPAERRQEIKSLAEETTQTFLCRISGIRRMLAKDVEAAYAGDPACKSLDEAVLCYPGLEAVTVHRLAHALHLLHVPMIPRMMSEYAHSKTGIDIHPGASIGEYFFIDHGTGVVVGETAFIGNWVKLYQGVTLGAVSFPKDEAGELIRSTKRHPTLEDNVVVYANATILGGKTVIGKGSVVGSSVWLTHSLPAGTTIMIEKPNLKVRNAQTGEYDWII